MCIWRRAFEDMHTECAFEDMYTDLFFGWTRVTTESLSHYNFRSWAQLCYPQISGFTPLLHWLLLTPYQITEPFHPRCTSCCVSPKGGCNPQVPRVNGSSPLVYIILAVVGQTHYIWLCSLGRSLVCSQLILKSCSVETTMLEYEAHPVIKG